MNKRLRSRVLAASIVSTSLVGTGGLLFSRSALAAQDMPSASAELDRGARLYDQKNYADAKKILSDIDPAQLPEDQRARRADLMTKTDMALAQAMGPNGRYDAAQHDMDAGKLASSAAGFQGLIDDASVPADVKDKAKVQLALVKQSQADQVAKMKTLLDQSQALYDQGKLDEAQTALDTVKDVGADLGWDNNNRIPQLQQRISERKVALARGATGAGSATMASAPDVMTPATMGAMPPGTMAAPATMAVLNPMDVTPGTPVAGASGQQNLVNDYLQDRDVRKQRIYTLYKEAQHASDDALAQHQYAQAVAQAQSAVDMIDQNRNLFSDIEATSLRDAAQRQLDNAQARAQQAKIDHERDLQNETANAAHQESYNARAIRTKQVAALVADAHRLYEAQKFRESADLLRQAVIIDPQDVDAQFFLRMTLDKITDREAGDVTHRTGQEVMRQNVDSLEHIIPYADLMVYPDNWPEITRKRGGGESTQDTPANRAVRDRLEENLKEITADQQGLEKVLNYLRDNMGANIFVNWTALQTAGIDKNTPVTISLKEVPFRKALTTILSTVGGATANLTYTIDDGIITISTKEDLSSAKYQLVRVFDIRDMLVQPNSNIQAPTINLQSITSSQGQGQSQSFGSGGSGGGGFGGGGGQGGGGGSGQGLFSTNTQGQQSTQSTQQQRQDLVNALVDTIKSTVAPDTWRDNGGSIGSIRELNGQLIVNQTVDNQLAVYGLLQQLRETRAIQIAVEARLLLVSNNFLDDFRVGWDLQFPAGLIGGNVGAFGIGNLNSFNQAIPQATSVPGSIANFAQLPSLNLSASIIDNWTLNLLLQATQADKRSVSLTAPRVTLFNGQPGFISVTNQQNIVESFNQTTASGGIAGNGAVGTNLNIATLNTGVVLDVTATVSADRRYVVMTIHPTLATLDGIDTFTLGNAVSTANNTNNTNNNNNSSTTALGGAFVQLPKIASTEINTMVSIPDGGTLLIGGQKLVGEVEVEVGVPVLSKIPGLNRLFTNRSYVKDERTLLVLVRPNIIIHKEIETDLFGAGYDRPTGLPGNTGGTNTSSFSMPSSGGGPATSGGNP